MFQAIGYVVGGIALATIAATMLARANDLRWRKGLVWNARLIGFILSGVAPFGIVMFDWIQGHQASLFEVIFYFGLMLVFVTTPYLPPWWKWISGWHSADDQIRHTDDRRERQVDLKGAPDRRKGQLT